MCSETFFCFRGRSFLFDLDQQLRSPSSRVLVHVGLKWLHCFTPDDAGPESFGQHLMQEHH